MLGGGKVKQIYELKGQGCSKRQIAKILGISRNTVTKYLNSPEIPKAKPRTERSSKLDPFKEYLQERIAAGITNCVILMREVKNQGYSGGYTILRDYIKPFRKQKQSKGTIRFETEPGEQAQVDWGLFRYHTGDGKLKRIWAFIMVLSWSRAIYVEFVRRADITTFIRCHINAFYRLGIPKNCLYDNAKVVVLGRDETGEPKWNSKFLDFALRMGFNIKLCRPYRAQTKGRVENGVKYLRYNFWPVVRFTDDTDLNQQVLTWINSVANLRIHGTTGERPIDRLTREQPYLRPCPKLDKLSSFLREERKVGRDGFVVWERSFYGVPIHFVEKTVEVQVTGAMVQIWFNGNLIAVHPQANRNGQRLTLPGQWEGISGNDINRKREPLAVQIANTEVQKRPLTVYENMAEAVIRS